MTEARLAFFPQGLGRKAALEAGFRFGHVGTHTSRTIMVEDLEATLAAVPASAKPAEYATAIVDDNCLGKQTSATRRHSLQHLRELYALDPALPVFRILRRLWEMDAPGRPLLAILAGLTRDPLLMATAQPIIAMAKDSEFNRAAVRAALEKFTGERLNESTLDKVVRNAASSWSQSGHLEGRTFKFRRIVQPTAPTVAYALYLATTAGFQGEDALSSGWLKVLDCDTSLAMEMATAAKRMGLLDLKMAGGIFELSVERLDPYASTDGRGRQ